MHIFKLYTATSFISISSFDKETFGQTDRQLEGQDDLWKPSKSLS